jgi:DNA-directed RNA polymerase specialized sigma24 family protein
VKDKQEERLRLALENLPDEMRQCFLLRFTQGFDENEIALLMKMPLEMVRVNLYQVRQRLRFVIARLKAEDKERP